MDRFRIKILIDKVLAKEASEAEEQELDRLYQQYDARLGYTDELDDVQLKTYKELFYSGIYERIKETGIIQPADRVHPLWPRVLRITGIAAAVAAITLGVWLYYASGLFGGLQVDGRHAEFSSASQYDIAPGKNTATLTLANGKIITLSDAKTGVVIGNDKLAYNDGSTVATLSPSGRDAKGREGNNSGNPLSPQGGSLPGGERSKVQMLTASTPRGGTYQVTLPDGTKVWLNADSKITFPSQFSGKERKILLSGEAYFEVAKLIRLSPSGGDGRRPERVPFIVESNGQQVEVLGTHFNISAYPDEGSTKTTLLEGSVRVAFGSPSAPRSSMSMGERSVVLKPRQQAILNVNQISVKQVDTEGVISWKLGYFMFNETPLETAMKQISRWYNVEVVYEDPEAKLIKLGGSASRYDNVARILKTIENTGAVRFKISGRKIIVL